MHVNVFIVQGLYEYVCPLWQERPRPAVDDYDVKSFGSSVPARVMNPNSNPLKLPGSSSGKLEGIVPPRYVILLEFEYSCCLLYNLLVKSELFIACSVLSNNCYLSGSIFLCTAIFVLLPFAS